MYIRTASDSTLDQALWIAIRNRTHAISFNRYTEYMNRVLQGAEWFPDPTEVGPVYAEERDSSRGVRTYHALKHLTESFLLHQCGVAISGKERFESDENACRPAESHEPVVLHYIERPLLIELIYTYWHEEGLLIEALNSVALRLQNVYSSTGRDPLANMEIDPLRPLNDYLWGFIKDEVNRLSVERRASEYLHQYGLQLHGKAAVTIQAADHQSKFLEALHRLLYQSSVFFKQDDQTTITSTVALVNSLKEVHLILAQGAHNQFGDLPWTARVETLVVQFIMTQPAMKDFLQSRATTPCPEAWMAQVDAMKSLQGWSDVSVTHFRDLAVYGEQILLSVRYGGWVDVVDEDHAGSWARFWRPEIQGYLYAHRAVTGVDLTDSNHGDTQAPGVHLNND